MKKLGLIIIVICLALFCFSAIASAEDYTNDAIGVSFSLPEGWTLTDTQKAFASEYVEYSLDDSVLMFYATNLWYGLPTEVKDGHSRKEFNDPSFWDDFTVEHFENRGYINTSLDPVQLNGLEYFVASGQLADSEIPYISYIIINNGYLYDFTYSDPALIEQGYAALSETLDSATYANLVSKEDLQVRQEASEATGATISGFADGLKKIVSLFANILIYLLPLLIYNTIRKEPLTPKKALMTTVIYAILFAAIMVILWQTIGYQYPIAVFLLFSIINYPLLLTGKED